MNIVLRDIHFYSYYLYMHYAMMVLKCVTKLLPCFRKVYVCLSILLLCCYSRFKICRSPLAFLEEYTPESENICWWPNRVIFTNWNGKLYIDQRRRYTFLNFVTFFLWNILLPKPTCNYEYVINIDWSYIPSHMTIPLTCLMRQLARLQRICPVLHLFYLT